MLYSSRLSKIKSKTCASDNVYLSVNNYFDIIKDVFEDDCVSASTISRRENHVSVQVVGTV